MNVRNKLLLGAMFAAFVTQAQAGSEIETLIKMLHANGTVDDAQYGRLMDEIHAGTEKAAIEKKQMQAQFSPELLNEITQVQNT